MKRGLEWCARHGITSIHNMDGNLPPARAAVGDRGGGRAALPRADPVPLKNFMTLDVLEKASLMAERYRREWLSSGHGEGVLRRRAGILDGGDGRRLCRPAGLARRAAVLRRSVSPRWPSRPTAAACRSPFTRSATARCVPCSTATRRRRRKNGKRDSRHRIEHIEVTTAAGRAALCRARRDRLDAAAASAGRHGLAAGADRVAHRPHRWPLAMPGAR